MGFSDIINAICSFPIIIIDAKDGAENFYEKYGFTSFKDADNKLFIIMADIRASIGELIYKWPTLHGRSKNTLPKKIINALMCW